MKKLFPILLILIIIAGCKSNKNTAENKNDNKDTVKRWTFNRILKTNDYSIKYEKALEYYNREKYSKAIDIYEQLVPHFRGLDKGDEVYYMYAMSNFKIGDYLFAGYHFEKFYDMYPMSQYAEKSLFLSAYCYYLEAPRWSLDQQPTTDAIEQFQLFLSEYPNSNLIDSCNTIIDTLRYTLEKKKYMSGKLYYDLEYFKAASITLENGIKKYPDSPFNEKALFYIVMSKYKYARGSVEEKKFQRYKDALSECLRYQEHYPNGKFYDDILNIKNKIKKKIKKI